MNNKDNKIYCKEYWKVHKKNLKYIKDISDNELIIWESICNKYTDLNVNACYIFICMYKYIDDYNENNILYKNYIKEYTYMSYTKESIKYFESNKVCYRGEFGIKETRRDKLKEIYKKS